ncbi:MAG: class I SAM-dependent methyltransferase [Actinomycetota bacterium]
MAPALWAFTTFDERLRWTSGLSDRLFGLFAALYHDVCSMEGYGEALEQALLDQRGRPRTILDISTGTGHAARRLKRQYPEAEVVGVDISPEMIAIARHEALAANLTIDFQEGDTADLPYEDGSFDLVALQNAMPFPEEMMRVLRPKGKVLIIFSFGGPWIEAAWPGLAARLEQLGASHARGRRTGLGFYGVARKRA